MAGSMQDTRQDAHNMKELKSSEFSIKSLMKDTQPKQDMSQLLDQLSLPGILPPMMPNGLISNQLMFNMALSLHEKFLETMRQRGVLQGQNHPAYAGALPSSLPGFISQPSANLPRSRLEFLQDCQSQPWMASIPKRHHSTIPAHPGKKNYIFSF